MAEKDQTNRWRCCVTGCNPKLIGKDAAEAHVAESGHRIAKWPIRSAEGKRKAAIRNKTGYYRQYNVGEKSPAARGLPGYTQGGPDRFDEDAHPFSEEAVQG